MNYKKILFLGIFIGDLVLILWLISLIGFKSFGLFSLGYFGMVIISAFGIMSFDKFILKKQNYNPDEWKYKYLKQKGKVKYYRLVWVVGIITASIIMVHYHGYPFMFGMKTAFGVNLYLIYRCQDFLHVLTNMVNTLGEVLDGKK